jgi:hypothetical protein
MRRHAPVILSIFWLVSTPTAAVTGLCLGIFWLTLLGIVGLTVTTILLVLTAAHLMFARHQISELFENLGKKHAFELVEARAAILEDQLGRIGRGYLVCPHCIAEQLEAAVREMRADAPPPPDDLLETLLSEAAD